VTSRKRGVSDVVSFTLVFATIIFMIGVVTVTGIGTLDDVREGTESNVAEETMRNYASTLADHRTASAPRRSTTIKLQGHSLTRSDSLLKWSVGGNPTRIENRTGALVRTTDTDTDLVYESGALFREQDGGSVVVRRPPLRCGDQTAHLPMTRLVGEFNISSDNRVTLESELVNQSLTTRETDSVTVYTDETARPDSWGETLTSGGWTGTGPSYTCDSIERVVVHQTTVRISVVN